MQVKMIITGSGKADKKEIKSTIKKIFKIREKGAKAHFDNSADALAIAICHAKNFCCCSPLVLALLGLRSASVPNNRVGVHILDPNEINDAAKLINSSGGDWGYVTIPIRSNDRDRDKWLKFSRMPAGCT